MKQAAYLANALEKWLISILHSGSDRSERPLLRPHNESSVSGLFVIGDLAGASVIKYAMKQGYEVIEHIASLPNAIGGPDPSLRDVIIVGAGAAGLNAALQAKERGMRYLLLEKEQIANTIENFPEGKWVYSEPDSQPPVGKLWLDGASKEELISRWHQIINENELNIHTMEALCQCRRDSREFQLSTTKGIYRSKRVVLATGQRGNPRKLDAEGEGGERIYHRLYSPRKYEGERILVVGGGNSAVEAALTLSEQNTVYLAHRGDEFSRIFRDNEQKLKEAIASGKIEPLLGSTVVKFEKNQATLNCGKQQSLQVSFDHAFVLIGAEIPREFLKSLGLRMENEWTGSPLRSLALVALSSLGLWLFGGSLHSLASFLGLFTTLLSLGSLIYFGVRGDRLCWLGLSFFIGYSVYGIKLGVGTEFWPYRNWGYHALSFFNRPWSYWYTVIYTGVMTLFGLQALKRWGIDPKDKFQIWRYVSLIGFQWVFFFLVPEFLFQQAVKYQWMGEKLAHDPTFTEQAWRSYGLVYAWPLFFYTFFYNPHQVWVVWGVMLTFVLIPVLVLFHGKRYCSWICGCGGLAETLGDRWRHLAPKGRTSIRWEWMNLAILIFATLVTVLVLARDVYPFFSRTADWGIQMYRLSADLWLVGILPVTLYPFLGGKIWCRYWCPLAKLMQLQSHLFTRLRWGRFKIVANDKCIACDECSRNCQVGIDVMSFALKQEVLDNQHSSCIGCGICVTVCPMDTLSFGSDSSSSSSRQ